MADSYGPALPPGFREEAADCDDREEAPISVIDSESRNRDDTMTYGPSIPFMQTSSGHDRRIGPTLPPELQRRNSDESVPENEEESCRTNDDDSPLIGPSVPSTEEKVDNTYDLVHSQVEGRAKKMKDKLTDKPLSKKQSREEWMIELPPEKQLSGLGSRKFRTTALDLGDRSVWTNLPSDRKPANQSTPKSKTGEDNELTYLSERDKEMEKIVSHHNEHHRKETLYEIHQRKRAAKTGDNSERIPFDRERDLQIQHFMPSAKRKDVINKSAKDLNSKFAPSTRERFL